MNISAKLKVSASKSATSPSRKPLASIEEEKSFENLRFQTETRKETEKIKDRRSELKNEDE